jgi:hypothetical protein
VGLKSFIIAYVSMGKLNDTLKELEFLCMVNVELGLQTLLPSLNKFGNLELRKT